MKLRSVNHVTICEETVSHKIIFISNSYLQLLECHSAILYRKWMKFSVLETAKQLFLNTKYHKLPLQNGGRVSNLR